jgi:zinc transport system permease protein
VGLDSFLFGDILLVRWSEVALIWCGALAILGLLAWRWQALLLSTLNEELATSAGIRPAKERLILTLALAVAVAVALKVVGALLIGALLIIPAAAARGLARSPEAMALVAAALGAVSALGGLWLSLRLDTPAGPSIVSLSVVFYLAAMGFGRAVRG